MIYSTKNMSQEQFNNEKIENFQIEEKFVDNKTQ